MLKNLCLLFIFLVLLTPGYTVFSQTPPTFNVDLSGSTDTTVTILSQRRNGNWCGDNNCIIFNIKVNSGSDLINFTANQITGASFYSVNCGPQIPIGTPACITGLSTVQISFCKPGNNPVDYFITTTRTVKASGDLNLRQLCSGTMSVTGLKPASVIWTSIFPGIQGAYNSYLSPPSGSNTTTVTPPVGAPPYIDYRVSGAPNTNCSGGLSDTVRVYTSPPLTVAISPVNPMICSGNSVTLTATPSGGLPGYTYIWNTGATTPSITVLTPGTYTVSVMDQLSSCPPSTQQIVVGASPTPAAPTAAGTTICSGGTATLTATGPGGTYSWYTASTGGTLLGTGANFTTPILTTNATYYVETLLGCISSRTPVTVSVTPPPAAPTAIGTTICAGGTATLAATAPGGTYQWYNAATGGTLVGTGVSITTPILTNSTTYYVQTILNGCIGPRSAVTVSVTPLPASPTAAGVTICAGNTTTLTATAPGGSYQWYSAATGGALLGTNASYSTSALNATTTFYVQTTVNGCTSPRTPVEVTVIPQINPEFKYTSGTYCKLGNSTTPAPQVFNGPGNFRGSTGLVIDPTTGVINVAGTVPGNYLVSYTSTSQCPRTTTAIINISVVPDASFSYSGPFCLGATNPLPNFGAAGSAGSFSSTDGLVFVNTTTGEIDLGKSTSGTYTITNTISGGSCADVKTSIVTINTPPASPTALGATICAGSNTTLTATATGGSYSWFNDASGGTPISSLQTLITPILINTTTFYVETTVGGCTSSRTAVTVVVNPTPSPPTAVGTVICAGTSTSLTATGPGGTYQWYNVASGGTILNTGPSYNTPILTANTTYYVETVVNGCAGPRTAVAVTVTPLPAVPTSQGASICSGNSALITASAPGGVYEWYDAASGGNLLSTGATYRTPTLTINTIYYVRAIVNGCAGPRAAVTVTVTPIPLAPTAAGVNICSGTTANLTATAPGGTYRWYDAAAGGNLLQTGNTFTTASLTVNSTFFVETTINGCTSQRTAVNVTISPIPIAPTVTAPVICIGNSTTLTATGPGGNYQWYDAESGGNLLQTGSSYTTSVLSSSTTFYIQTTINGCISPRKAVTVKTIPIINPEFEYSSGTYCKSGPAMTPAPIQHTAGGGTFSATPGLVFANANTGEINVAATPLGTYTITFTNNTQCPRASTVNITITNAPDATFSYTSASFCKGAVDAPAIFPPGASAGIFSAMPAGLVFISKSTGEINFSASTPGIYQVSNTIAANGGCAAASHTRSISINASPLAPSVVSGTTVCANNSTVLTASAPGGVYEWFNAAVGGTLLATGALFTTPVLKTTTTYYVQSTTNGCTGPRTAVTVQVIPVIDPEFEYSSGTYCKSGISVTPPPGIYTLGGGTFSSSSGLVFRDRNTGEIDVLASAIGTYTVSFTNNSPCPRVTFARVTITNFPDATFLYNRPYCPGEANPLPDFPSSGSAGLFTSSSPALVFVSTRTGEINLALSSPGTYILTNTIAANGGCTTATYTSTVTINPSPVTPVARDISVCRGSNAVLSVSDDAGNYQWFDSASGGTVIGTGATFMTPVLNSTTRYYVQEISNNCVSPRKEIVVTVNSIPVVPVVVSNSPVCTGNAIVLGATYVPGATYTWEGPNNFISNLQNPVINLVNMTNAGKYSVFITVNGCVSAISSTDVKINEAPITISGPDQTVCVSTNAINLQGSVQGISTTGIWSSSGTGTFSPANTSMNATYIPSAADRTGLKIILTLTSTNNVSCAPTSSSTTVTLIPLPIISAGPDQAICADGSKAVLLGSVTGATGAIWTTAGDGRFSPSNAALEATYTPGSKDIKIGWTLLTLSSTGNGLCTSISDETLITINPLPKVSAGKDKVIRLNESIALNDVEADPEVQYQWSPALGLTDYSVKNPVFSGTKSQTYTLTITNKWGCITSDQVFVKVLEPITIPNTFTPNGDGSNDLWNIAQLKNYSEATVFVYNRYGVQLFYSQGYEQPWDGRFKGVEVPDGTYYYVIDTKMGEKFSGWILIVR